MFELKSGQLNTPRLVYWVIISFKFLSMCFLCPRPPDLSPVTSCPLLVGLARVMDVRLEAWRQGLTTSGWTEVVAALSRPPWSGLCSFTSYFSPSRAVTWSPFCHLVTGIMEAVWKCLVIKVH